MKKIGRMRKARAPSCHIYFQENTWMLELQAELVFLIFIFTKRYFYLKGRWTKYGYSGRHLTDTFRKQITCTCHFQENKGVIIVASDNF